MSKKITISESELHDIIFEAVNNYMVNEDMEEGFFNNLRAGWNAGKNAKVDQHKGEPKDAAGMIQNNLSQRFNAAKKGFGLQKNYTRMTNLKQELQQLVQDGVINPKQTVQQLLANFGGFGQAKAGFQKQAKGMGTQLKESIENAVEKALTEMLNEQQKKED